MAGKYAEISQGCHHSLHNFLAWVLAFYTVSVEYIQSDIHTITKPSALKLQSKNVMRRLNPQHHSHRYPCPTFIQIMQLQLFTLAEEGFIP